MKLLHQLYARLFGYFWLPCPKCGAMFGGHQVRPHGAHVTVREGDGMHCYCVCPACDTPELRAENDAELQARIFGGTVELSEEQFAAFEAHMREEREPTPLMQRAARHHAAMVKARGDGTLTLDRMREILASD